MWYEIIRFWDINLHKITLTWIIAFAMIAVGGLIEIMQFETSYRWWLAGIWIVSGCIGALIEVWRR